MKIFLKRRIPPQDVQAGPPGSFPEEGIVIIGDESSFFTAPKVLLLGHMVEVEAVILMTLVLCTPQLMCVSVS